MATPNGHPAIPAGTQTQDVVAIVTVHDPSAPWINAGSPFPKTDHLTAGNASGSNIFLTLVANQPYYRMGRAMATRTARQPNQDVYLPSSAAAMRQCILMPDWDRDCWRVQSASEVLAHVNGAPIQNDTTRTRKWQDQLPTTVYLKQGELNVITIKSCRVDVWLMKSVREVFGPRDYVPPRLDARLQNVAHRGEPWALDRYIMTPELVSRKTVRVIDRFAGEMKAAKVFRIGDDPEQVRDREFLAFAKQDVDSSIVRYQQATAVNNFPAITTEKHVGFVSYNVLRDDIHRAHPGIRFSIASKLTRRLFPALAWMHFHGIIHGNVSNDNVLIRLVDQKAEHVLVTDYTTARPCTPGTSAPAKDMLIDGQATMKVIEDCCDIWTFRNGPTAKAVGEWLMERNTLEAMREWRIVQRCSADFFERRGNSHSSPKGIRLERLQNKLGNAWSSAQAAQKQNLLEKEVAYLSKSKIDEKTQEWESVNLPQDAVYKQYMILTLGHDFLDSLADQLHVKPWDTMPQEVCAAIKQAGGDLEEPWRTFDVQKTIMLDFEDADQSEQVMAWLAKCCEVYPKWCKIVKAESEKHLGLSTGTVDQRELHNLHNALQVHDQLPASMTAMFDRFASMTGVPLQLEETYQVWYHIPSRMFNLTQLQRLADPDRLATTITEGQTRYDDFVEVRGDPNIEGCYAPLSLLADFTEQLGLQLPQLPSPPSDMPTFDPADFSQVPQTRIVLARPGLIGYGSMLRTADQCNFLYSRNNTNYITPSAFIPTYFGDMKVLPNLLPSGLRSYERPEHWSKYKTADEFETAAGLSKRRRLEAIGLGPRTPRAGGGSSQILPSAMEVDDSALGQLLRNRERIRAEAPLPPRRAVPEASEPSPKRARGRTPTPPTTQPEIPDISVSFVQRMEDAMQRGPQAALPTLSNTSFMNNSFMKRNTALLDTPPNDPTNVNTSFTVHDEAEGLEEDWKKVEAMLAQMPGNEDEHVEGVFGFQFHTDEDEAGYLAEVEGPAVEEYEATEVEPSSFYAASNSSTPEAKTPTQSFLTSQFQQRQHSRRAHSASQQPWNKTHKRGISDATTSSDDLPPTEPSSPLATRQKTQPPVQKAIFGDSSASVFGSFSGFGNTFGSNVPPTDSTVLSPPITAPNDVFGGNPSKPFVSPFAPPRPSGLGPNVARGGFGGTTQPSGPTSQPRSSTSSTNGSGSNRPSLGPDASTEPPVRRAPPVGSNPPAARSDSAGRLTTIQEQVAGQDGDGDADMPDTDEEDNLYGD